jgi:hypothetical protein
MIEVIWRLVVLFFYQPTCGPIQGFVVFRMLSCWNIKIASLIGVEEIDREEQRYEVERTPRLQDVIALRVDSPHTALAGSFRES